MAKEFEAWFMRGGSSKGLFVRDSDLPNDRAHRNQILLEAMGSPDPYKSQMDGLGGGYSSVSKALVIRKPNENDSNDARSCHVVYEFGQVGIDTPVMDWNGNCGNLTSAVAAFAIESGVFTPSVEDKSRGFSTVKLWQNALKEIIIAEQPIHADGRVREDGDCRVDGVAFPGAEVKLRFLLDSESKPTFPTGKTTDLIKIPDSLISSELSTVTNPIPVSLVAAGNAHAFVRASDLCLNGLETNLSQNMLHLLEYIREEAAVRMGMAKDIADAKTKPAFPKIAFVSPACTFLTSDSRKVHENEVDLVSRIISDKRVHNAFTATGAISMSVAACVPGTVVHDLANTRNNMKISVDGSREGCTRIGHPAGSMAVGAVVRLKKDLWVADEGSMARTARTLMRGFVRIVRAKL